jgi:glycosyltransferase involved in cell wall biosynthesis
MKIAYVVHDYNKSGGHSRYVAELAERFSLEHDVHVFANRIQQNCAKTVRFHHVPAVRTSALTSILSFAATISCCVKEEFDIVHVQGYCGLRGNVITTHACNEAWYRALKQDGLATPRDRVFHSITSRLEQRLYGNSNGCQVIAVSHQVARGITELYHCRAPVQVIYHGVDLEAFSPQSRTRFRTATRRSLGVGQDETVFLFVGNLRKGARQCIEAIAQIPSGLLLLVSPSPANTYSRLSARLCCADRVKFLGPTHEIHKIYAAVDGLVLPTPYDTFGLVCTEAMACGLPVVVSARAGASELIEDRRNGLVLQDPSDSEALAYLMAYIARDNNLASEIGAAARRTVESFSWDAVAQRTLQVYERAARIRR